MTQTTLVNALRTKDTLTLNGAVTNSTSLNPILDLFFTIGAMRKYAGKSKNEYSIKIDESHFIPLLDAAISSDVTLTKKCIFWARDIRGGAGERNIFRVAIRYLANKNPKLLESVIQYIPEYGRWDDLFVLFDTDLESNTIELIAENLLKGNQLTAKWMPRLSGKTSKEKKKIANKIRNYMQLTPSQWRKLVTSNTRVVETQMCENKFEQIEFSHVPSLAIARYAKAFNKKAPKQFNDWKALLSENKTKINTAAVFPYDIVKTLKHGDVGLSNEQWKALPDLLTNPNVRILPVCDTSGSMNAAISKTTSALDVSVSLGLYISERNIGAFKDAFVTFSERPTLQYLKGNLSSRYQQLSSADWGMNTDIEAVFDLILKKAKENSIPKNEMPNRILIISDMEFDEASDNDKTNLETIKEKWAASEYEMPALIFWNLMASSKNFPATASDRSTALISGLSPSILKTVLSDEEISPISVMMNALGSKRYENIV